MKKIRIWDKHTGSATLPFSRLNKELNSAADAVYKLKQNPTKSRDIARLLHFFISRPELLRPPPAFYLPFIFQGSEPFLRIHHGSATLATTPTKLRHKRWLPGVTKRDVVYLGWPIAPSCIYESQCGGWGGVAGSHPMSTAVHITWHLTYLWVVGSVFPVRGLQHAVDVLADGGGGGMRGLSQWAQLCTSRDMEAK